MKRVGTAVLCIVLLLLCVRVSAAETVGAADWTSRCSFDFGAYESAERNVLHRAKNVQTFDAGASFSLTWADGLNGARLCMQWRSMPEAVRVIQYDAKGAFLAGETLSPHPETVTPLLPEARRAVVQAGDAGMQLQIAAVYGPGERPDPFHDWQELPDRLDYLLIATHPDDDVLFLGSVVPVYGAEAGRVGTIAYVTCDNRTRMSEAENGAWAMGLRYRPVFFGLPDVRREAPQEQKDTFRYDELLLLTVRAYRSLRPLVVFAQDENGEYGHWQHILTSKAARDAFALAADPTYDPESAAACGTWQVQKLFLHLYAENALEIDAHAPLSFFDGLDAWQVARIAYQKHETQQQYSFSVKRDDKPYAFNRFGMAEGVVEVGADVFDNIDETLLSGYVPPPTPEPTEKPTPKPTAAPTGEPTEKPAPTPEPTAAPTKAPTPEPEPAAKADRRAPLLVLGIAAVVAAAAAIAWLTVGRARKR